MSKVDGVAMSYVFDGTIGVKIACPCGHPIRAMTEAVAEALLVAHRESMKARYGGDDPCRPQ